MYVPSEETIKFLDSNDTILDNAKQKIIKNAKTSFEEEKIIYRTNLVAAPDVSKIWKSGMLSINEYHELWLHRWLSVYTLNRLRHTNDNSETDKTKFVELFKVVVNYIPSYLRRLEDVNLREADLREAYLEKADLERANLRGATNLSISVNEAKASGALI